MSMQGTTATIRRQQAARRPALGALAVDRGEPGWIRGLLVLFLITLFLPQAVGVQAGPISLTPAILVALALFPALVFGGRIKFVWPDAIVVLLFTSMFYSMVISESFGASIEKIGRYILGSAVPYLVGRYVGSRPELFNTFMRRTMTVMAVLAVFLLIESLARKNIHSIVWGLPYAPHPEQRLGLTRAYGWTNHSIMLGVSYAVFVPVMLVAGKEKLKGLGRFPWLKLGLLLIGVFTSLSTGAWLPAFMGIGFVAWDYFKMLRPSTRWLLLSVGSFSMYFLLEVLSNRPLMRIIMMDFHLSSPNAWHYRWELYNRIYAVMPGYEWFGHGLGTPEYSTGGYDWSIDNNYLVLLLKFGRVGLTLSIVLAASVLVYGWKSVWSAPDTPYRRVARAVMYAVATVAVTQFSVALFSTADMLYWLFMGLGIGMAQGLAPKGKKPVTKSKPKRQRGIAAATEQRQDVAHSRAIPRATTDF